MTKDLPLLEIYDINPVVWVSNRNFGIFGLTELIIPKWMNFQTNFQLEFGKLTRSKVPLFYSRKSSEDYPRKKFIMSFIPSVDHFMSKQY
jgi:hypothetical protein